MIAHNIIKRDGTCRITNYTEQTEAVHIIPERESEWFHARGMTRRAPIQDESNFILLKVDVHKQWDQRQSTLAPRIMGDATISLATYIFKRQPLWEVVNLYHDVCMQSLSGIDLVFTFCRFAWTIFESLDIFLDQGCERWLRVINPYTGMEETK